MLDEVKILKRVTGFFKASSFIIITISVVAGISSAVLKLRESRSGYLSCLPDSNVVLPFARFQTVFNPTQKDALIKSFAAEYIRLTRNESITNYWAATKNARYIDQGTFSKNLLKAINFSIAREKERNMEAYSRSNITYRELKEKGLGWVFLVDSILVYSMPTANSSKVVIHGEYQITFDQAKVDAPHRLYGYKEIVLFVLHDEPKEGDGLDNEYGLYVMDSIERDISPVERAEIFERLKKEYGASDPG